MEEIRSWEISSSSSNLSRPKEQSEGSSGRWLWRAAPESLRGLRLPHLVPLFVSFLGPTQKVQGKLRTARGKNNSRTLWAKNSVQAVWISTFSRNILPRCDLLRDSTSPPCLQIKQRTAPPAPIICPFLHGVIYPLTSGGLQLSVVKPQELLHNACVFSTGGIEKAQEGDHICEQQDSCLSVISRKVLLPKSRSYRNPLPNSHQTVTRKHLKILASIY